MTFTNSAITVLGILVMVEAIFIVFQMPLRIDVVFNNFFGVKNETARQIMNFNSRQEELKTILARSADAVRVKDVDCQKVFQGQKKELRAAKAKERQPITIPDDDAVERLASNCSHFLQHYGFITDHLTDLEKSFPLAYSVLAYKQASQVVDLLRAVYRPQNFYCLHVDRKTPCDFRHAMEAVSRCFPNVFIASSFVDVRWGFYTVLEPEIVCMGDLWRNKTWKYFINLTGQEYPLRTNYELVRILSAWKGASDISGFVPDKGNINYRWKKFLPAPHNITVYKGAVHVVVSRAFVDYVLHDPKAQDFLQWCKQTRHPDEHFFNSLYYNAHLRVPGSVTGNETEDAKTKQLRKIYLNRYKNWVPKYRCPGRKVVRGICILNVLDLPFLNQRKELFANKFYADFSHVALQCLAESLHNRTREQTFGRMGFNVTYYERFIFRQG